MMKKNIFQCKIWIITSSRQSISSVNFITSQLNQIYRGLFPNYTEIDIENKNHVALLINNPNPEYVIVTSPYVIHSDTFNFIAITNNSINYIIHILGDFIRHLPKLQELNPILKSKKIKFISPSKRYTKVIGQFFNNTENIDTLPIPLGLDKQSIKKTFKQKDFRKKYSIEENAIIACSSGRIIPQKNIFETVSLLNDFRKKYPNFKIYYFIIGEIEHFDNSTLKTKIFPTELFTSLKKIENQYNIWIPQVNRDQLWEFFKESNIYISLSTFHDESFGLSPREAAFFGNSLLLSNWGGFSDFADAPDSCCQLIKIKMNDHFIISKNEFSKKLNLIIKEHHKERNIIYFQNILCKEKVTKTYIHFYKNKKKINAFEGIILKKDFSGNISNSNYKSIYKEMWNR